MESYDPRGDVLLIFTWCDAGLPHGTKRDLLDRIVVTGFMTNFCQDRAENKP